MGFLRVIGGEYGGRKLRSPSGTRTRPTADRVREALFSILSGRTEGALFLDAFAGTGAVGIEALSRGARRCVFVESDRRTARILAENVASVGAGDRARILTRPFSAVVRTLASEEGAFGVVFLDPPFGAGAILGALRRVSSMRLLGPRGILVAQHDARMELPAREGGLALERSVRYGSSRLSFFAPRAEDDVGAIDSPPTAL